VSEFEARLRAGEYFSSLRIPPGMWSILRLDGRSFHAFTEKIGAARPYDERLRDRMADVARAVFEELGGVLAVTHSDEVSVLFRPEWDAFDRRVEKLVSVSASLAGAELARGLGSDAPRAAFDARVWIGAGLEDCVDYFRWRQSDAGRCAINAWVYWKMRDEGASPGQATTDLDRRGFAWKNEWLFQRGINFDRLPAWQKRGVGVYWETVVKPAVDRRTGQPVEARRRRVKVDLELPLKEPYDELIRTLASPHSPR
jgi:tRNA(His) guanylyltransferase